MSAYLYVYVSIHTFHLISQQPGKVGIIFSILKMKKQSLWMKAQHVGALTPRASSVNSFHHFIVITWPIVPREKHLCSLSSKNPFW